MATRTDLFWVQRNELVIEEGFNIRYEYGDIQELADSIVENGVTNPIHAYQKPGDINRFTLIEGHRRIRAIDLAIKQGKLKAEEFKIPMVKGKKVSDETRTLGLVLYNSGKSLTMLEEAMVYERLDKYGMTVAELHKKTGKSTTHITNCLRLISANLATKKMIMDGKVSATLVSDLLKTKEPKVVEEELRAAAAGKTKDVIDEPAPAVKKEGKGADDSDIPGKEDNIKISGKNTQTLPEEKASKPVKITKKDLAPKKPKEPTYNREQMKTVLESLLLECKEFQNKKIPIELDIENWMTINVDQ